jgi:hypothetical protein
MRVQLAEAIKRLPASLPRYSNSRHKPRLGELGFGFLTSGV